MENERTQFTFYKSFYDALSMLRKATDRAMAYDAICRFALFGVEPDVEGMPEPVAMAMLLILPTLTSGRRKAFSGKAGGLKQSASKPEANWKQSESKPEANQKQNASKKEKEGEIEIENESSPPSPPQGETAAPAQPSPPPVISFPCLGNEVFHVYPDDVKKWEILYSAVDIKQALFNMYGWLDGHPLKTKRGMTRFINSWLAGEQNCGGTRRKGDADHGCDATDGAAASKWGIVYSG